MSWWAISRPRKRRVTLTLSPSSKKRRTAFIFDVVVVVVDAGTELDLLDLDDLLLLAGLGGLLLLVEVELAVIEDLADRRIGVRGDLDEIESGVFGQLERVREGDNAPGSCPPESISCTSRARISWLVRGPSFAGPAALSWDGEWSDLLK